MEVASVKKRLVKKLKKKEAEKCLPCLIHNQTKTIAEIVTPILKRYNDTYHEVTKLPDVTSADTEAQGKAYDKMYDTYYKELKSNSITAFNSDDRMEFEDGTFEFWNAPNSDDSFMRRLK
jgi:hypothetical protein